jgi:outer membrane murein-binding lipoprotein Lpp
MEAIEMIQVKRGLVGLSVASAAVLGALSLGGCASTDNDHQFSEMNERISAADARATAADQKADQALSADQAAQAAAARVNERVDTLTTTVDGLERAPPPRTPRG